jgi:hypothetical protein
MQGILDQPLAVRIASLQEPLPMELAGTRARKLVDGSKFTGRRPEISEIVEGSSTS